MTGGRADGRSGFPLAALVERRQCAALLVINVVAVDC